MSEHCRHACRAERRVTDLHARGHGTIHEQHSIVRIVIHNGQPGSKAQDVAHCCGPVVLLVVWPHALHSADGTVIASYNNKSIGVAWVHLKPSGVTPGVSPAIVRALLVTLA